VNKSKFGTSQEYGELKVEYIPTGEIKKLKLGIRRMNYNNELIFCEAWGYEEGKPTDLNNPDNYKLIDIIPKETRDNEVLTSGEVRKLFADMYNNLPDDNSELIKVGKMMVKEVDERKDYVSRRLKQLALMLAGYEDDYDNFPIDGSKKEREKLCLFVDIGRAKIDELKKLQKELNIS